MHSRGDGRSRQKSAEGIVGSSRRTEGPNDEVRRGDLSFDGEGDGDRRGREARIPPGG